MPEVLVMLWVPNGILLTALFHYRARGYPAFAALIILAEIVADYPTFPVGQAVTFGAINLLEVMVAYTLLRAWRFNPHFAAPKDIAKFVVAGPGIAACLSALAGAAVYSSARGSVADFLAYAQVWWFSDGLGLMIITPLVLSLWPPAPPAQAEWAPLKWYDRLGIAASLGIALAFALSHQQLFFEIRVRPFILLIPTLYFAARFDYRVVTPVMAAAALLILYTIQDGHLPFGPLSIRETVASAQELIFIMSAMSLGFSALLAQHRASTNELEARVVERTAALQAANTQLEQLVDTDALTGVLNRRALFNALSRELDSERGCAAPLALIIFDIDHFKLVNDRYGHAAGDAVLRQVAGLANSLVHCRDVLARYGGEEFVIVLPGCAASDSLWLAERVRVALRSLEIPVGQGVLRVTASFGVTMRRPSDVTPDQILGRADEALYAAKAGGRDCVVVAGGDRLQQERAL